MKPNTNKQHSLSKILKTYKKNWFFFFPNQFGIANTENVCKAARCLTIQFNGDGGLNILRFFKSLGFINTNSIDIKLFENF